jgi:hypothetical protein
MATTTVGFEAGTPVSWLSSGGDKLLTLTSKANGNVHEGAKSGSFLNAAGQLPAFIRWRLESQVGAAATQGRELNLFVGQSEHATAGTDNPAQLTGADADVTSGTELLGQLDRVGSLPFSNAIGTTVQKVMLTSFPRSPYQIPVLHNDTGQTLGSTAGNHKLIATPYYQNAET